MMCRDTHRRCHCNRKPVSVSGGITGFGEIRTNTSVVRASNTRAQQRGNPPVDDQEANYVRSTWGPTNSDRRLLLLSVPSVERNNDPPPSPCLSRNAIIIRPWKRVPPSKEKIKERKEKNPSESSNSNLEQTRFRGTSEILTEYIFSRVAFKLRHCLIIEKRRISIGIEEDSLRDRWQFPRIREDWPFLRRSWLTKKHSIGEKNCFNTQDRMDGRW